MKLYWNKKADILSQVNAECMQSKDALNNRRKVMLDRERLINDQTKNKNKVSVNLIFSQIRTLVALWYTDDLKVIFEWYDVGDEEGAEYRQNLAEFERNEMEMEVWDYVSLRDKIQHGVWIKIFDRWSDERNGAEIEVKDPKTWLPDPKGWLKADFFRRHGFEGKVTKNEAKEQGRSNIDKLQDYQPEKYQDQNFYDNISDTIDQWPQKEYNIYNHFTKINGDIYLVTTSGNGSVMHRFIKIADLFDGHNIMPLSLFYFSPQRLNPYGTSLMDLSEDKQRALSELLNLAIIKAKRSSLGGTRLYDKTLIPNRDDLASLVVEPKLIGIDGKNGQIPLNNVMQEVPFQQVPNDNFNVRDAIQYESTVWTSLDRINMGVNAPWDMTATESQQLQANANVIFALTNSINFWWEKDFWRKRMYMVKSNMSDEKVIKVAGALGNQYIKINNQKLKTKYDPNIVIKSKQQNRLENQRTAQLLGAYFPYISEQWDFYKRHALRKIMTLNGIDDDEVSMLIWQSASEIEARRLLPILNEWENIEPITDISLDLDAMLNIFRLAIDTPAKEIAIQNILNLKKEKEKVSQQQAQSQQQNMKNISQAQITNQALQNQDWVISSQEVQPQ